MVGVTRRRWSWLLVAVMATVAACQSSPAPSVAELSGTPAVLFADSEGTFDVHLMDPGETPSDTNLVAAGVSVGGVFDRVRDGVVTTFESFDLSYEGASLFAYRTNGPWAVATAKPGVTTDIVAGPAEPQVIDTAHGVFVVFAPDADTCLVYRLEGTSAIRLATADECGVDPRAEKVVAVDIQNDGDDVSVLDLATGQSAFLQRVDPGVPLSVVIDGTRAALTADGEITTLYDLTGRKPPAETQGSVVSLAGDSMIVKRFDSERSIFDWMLVNPDRVFAHGKGDAGFDPSGAHVAFHIDDGAISHVALMDVTSGEVAGVGDLAGTVSISWIDEARVLVASSDGDVLIAGVDGTVHRLDTLGVPGAGGRPLIDRVAQSQFIDIHWLGEDSYGATLAVLSPAGDLIQVHDLSSADLWVGTEGYIVVAGVVGPEFETSLLVSVDVSTGRVVELDRAPAFETVQIRDNRVYYAARSEDGALEVRSSTLDGSSPPEIVYGGATIYLPGPAPTDVAGVAGGPAFSRG